MTPRVAPHLSGRLFRAPLTFAPPPGKRLKLLTLACACLGATLLAGCASRPAVEVPGTLAVHVNVPPHWNIFLEDRITEAFTDQLRDVFHHAGFDRPVTEVRYFDDVDRAPYLLTINLNEWRINRVGLIDCTFTAELRTPQATKSLGVYTYSTMRWVGGPGRFGLARSFEEAADGAIRELCRDVAKTELLPGLRNQAT
jgi:hypothetical protein